MQRQLHRYILEFRLKGAGSPDFGGSDVHRVCNAVGEHAPVIQERVACRARLRGGNIHQLAVPVYSVRNAAGGGIHPAEHLLVAAGGQARRGDILQIFTHYIQVFIALGVILFKVFELQLLFIFICNQPDGDDGAVRLAHRRSRAAGLALTVAKFGAAELSYVMAK